MGISGGSQGRRLNRNGLLRERGRQWFVCESLGGQRVRVEYVDGKMLVSYRHMYIREIDLEQGRTRPLVVERKQAGAPSRATSTICTSFERPA